MILAAGTRTLASFDSLSAVSAASPATGVVTAPHAAADGLRG